MTYTPDEIIIFLSCNHTARVDRRLPLGTEMQCRRCFRMAVVTDIPNYVVSCHGGKGRSCPAGRSFGTLEASAVQFAVRHRAKYPHHVTVITDGKRTVHRFGSDDENQGTLFGEVETKQPVRKRVVYSADKGFDDPAPF